ncbi:hypothetical protein KQX54_016081 [Cotesia glomerata]|uniref:Uncharacterized protein n=1 Tax=Cotesia glomerata TaxID=32391 RepID=A0AAV7HXC9_COTGL|nr:hypothetical protein KQX54_016081 [Cotesia glomerata]
MPFEMRLLVYQENIQSSVRTTGVKRQAWDRDLEKNSRDAFTRLLTLLVLLCTRWRFSWLKIPRNTASQDNDEELEAGSARCVRIQRTMATPGQHKVASHHHQNNTVSLSGHPFRFCPQTHKDPHSDGIALCQGTRSLIRFVPSSVLGVWPKNIFRLYHGPFHVPDTHQQQPAQGMDGLSPFIRRNKGFYEDVPLAVT